MAARQRQRHDFFMCSLCRRLTQTRIKQRPQCVAMAPATFPIHAAALTTTRTFLGTPACPRASLGGHGLQRRSGTTPTGCIIVETKNFNPVRRNAEEDQGGRGRKQNMVAARGTAEPELRSGRRVTGAPKTVGQLNFRRFENTSKSGGPMLPTSMRGFLQKLALQRWPTSKSKSTVRPCAQ